MKRRYLHVELHRCGVYVFASDKRLFEPFTLKDMDNDCHLFGSVSIPLSTFVEPKRKPKQSKRRKCK